MKPRLEEEAWRRCEQTLPVPTEDDSERRAPEDDYHSDSLTAYETLSKKMLWPTVLISWHMS